MSNRSNFRSSGKTHVAIGCSYGVRGNGVPSTIRTFFRCAVELRATLALIVEDPTAVRVCAYFETLRIMIRQDMSE